MACTYWVSCSNYHFHQNLFPFFFNASKLVCSRSLSLWLARGFGTEHSASGYISMCCFVRAMFPCLETKPKISHIWLVTTNATNIRNPIRTEASNPCQARENMRSVPSVGKYVESAKRGKTAICT